jgi:integrase
VATVFRRTERRPIPKSAEVIVKGGQRLARWSVKGRTRSAPVERSADGTECVVVKSGTWVAKYRDHTGRIVERSTGCREESTARQQLSAWEREQEQIRAGVLDAGKLDIARATAGPLEAHLDAYAKSLTARAVSPAYLANTLRALRRLAGELTITSLKGFTRAAVEPWFARAIAAGMGARTRNHYRDAATRFLNWCAETGRIPGHDLNRLPKADENADPRRKRRALTEAELARLLAVARTRPLDEVRTVRRGPNKGQLLAAVRPEVVAELEEVGRERVLIYRTLVLTGLRVNELRTLTVARLDLTPGAELIRLEAKNEKNRAGSTIPLRGDLSEELRRWVAERQLAGPAKLFAVTAGLRLILDRDLEAAGIPKRDGRGRTVDVHALRTTFGTMISTTGTAPRTAQAAMRHSDISLTMGTYTDPALLDVRQAMERLPSLFDSRPPTKTPPTGGNPGHTGALADKNGRELVNMVASGTTSENPMKPYEKAPVTSPDITGAESGRRDLNPRPLAPQASALAKLRHGPMGTDYTAGGAVTTPLPPAARVSRPAGACRPAGRGLPFRGTGLAAAAPTRSRAAALMLG